MRFIGKQEIILITITVAILLALGLNATVILFSLVICYKLLKKSLSVKLFSSKLFIYVITLIFYFSVLQISVLLAWLVSHDFPLDKIALFTFAILVLSLIWKNNIDSKKTENKKLKEKDPRTIVFYDYVSLFIAFIIVCLVVVGPIKNSINNYSAINKKSIAIDLINSGLDNSNHLSLVNDRVQLNRGVLYKTNVSRYVVFGNIISSYPPGWHSANVIIIKSLYKNIKVGGQSLLAYNYAKLFWFFVLVFCFCRSIFGIIGFLRSDKFKVRGYAICCYVWMASIISFFSYYMLLEQFKEGFFGFVPVLFSMLLLIPLLIQLSDNAINNQKTPFKGLLPLVLLSTSIILSWFLILPAFILIALYLLSAPINTLGIKLTLLEFYLYMKKYIIFVFVVSASIITQFLLLSAPGSRTFQEGVNDPGAITMHSNWYFVFVVSGIMLFYYLLKRQQKKYVSGLTVLLAALLLNIFFIYIFQILTINKPEYYFFKSLTTVMIIAAPMAIIGWLLFFRLLAQGLTLLSSVGLAIGFTVCMVVSVGIEPINTSNLSFIKGSRSFTNNENIYIFDSINNRSLINVKTRTTDVIMFTPGEVAHNIVGTNILRSIQTVDDCDGKIFDSLQKDNETLLLLAIDGCTKNKIIIVTKPQSYPEIVSRLNYIGNRDKVTVVPI